VRVVIQRVTEASVAIEGSLMGKIGKGVLLFVGAGREDMAEADRPGSAPRSGATGASMLAEKIANLRIFPDTEGRSNLSLLDTGGAALIISQFTLYADCRRGRRPSFTDAADPLPAEALVDEFRAALQRLGVPTATGTFGAHMTVSLVNDGPYTILLDTEVLAAPRDRNRSRGAASHATAASETEAGPSTGG